MKKINDKMRVCAQNRKFAHENQSLHTRVQILHDQKIRGFVNSINEYFAYINKKAEDFLFDLNVFI